MLVQFIKTEGIYVTIFWYNSKLGCKWYRHFPTNYPTEGLQIQMKSIKLNMTSLAIVSK